MATWKEVKDFLRGSYSVKKEEDNYVQFLQEFSDGRSQLVFVFSKSYKDTAWIEIASPIGILKTNDLNAALDMMDKATCGGLTKIGDLHSVRHCMPIADLSNEELVHPILLVAGAADTLEEKFIGSDDL